MDSLPLFFKLHGRRVVLVGDTEAAEAKLRLLMKTPAQVLWLGASPNAIARNAGENDQVQYEQRAFTAGDLAGTALVYVAVDDLKEARRISALCRAAGVPVNVVDRPELCDFTTPAIIDRDPLLIAVSSGGAAPVFARKLRAMIERLLPPAIGHLIGRAGRFRPQLARLLPDHDARRRFWEALFDTADPQGLIALTEKGFTQKLEALAKETAQSGAVGHVQLVGAGPGDPELLTIKAQRALQRADVILYDRLVNPAVLDFARRDADFIDVGKRRGDHGRGQGHIHDEMIRHAKAGRHVVRLKGGDPLVFGRVGEEVDALRRAGVAVDIVPGITALSACAAGAQIPLTHRDYAAAITLVTGHVKDGGHLDWRALAGPGRTLGVYMGINTADEIMEALLADGVDPDLPVAVIENGSHVNERRIYGRLDGLGDLIIRHDVDSPALILIGSVARLAKDWRDEDLRPALYGADHLALAS